MKIESNDDAALPVVCGENAVIVVAAPPSIVIVLAAVPVAVMLYPPAGAVSVPETLITTGLVIVAPFKAVIAVARSGYVAARPEPPLVVTGAKYVAGAASTIVGELSADAKPSRLNACVHGDANVMAEIVMMMSEATIARAVRVRLNINAVPRAAVPAGNSCFIAVCIWFE